MAEGETIPIAAHLGMAEAEFLERYTRVTADRRGLSLTEAPDGACVLLASDGLCRIHPVKPRQCRGFPVEWRYDGCETFCAGLQARQNEGRGDRRAQG